MTTGDTEQGPLMYREARQCGNARAQCKVVAGNSFDKSFVVSAVSRPTLPGESLIPRVKM